MSQLDAPLSAAISRARRRGGSCSFFFFDFGSLMLVVLSSAGAPRINAFTLSTFSFSFSVFSFWYFFFASFSFSSSNSLKSMFWVRMALLSSWVMLLEASKAAVAVFVGFSRPSPPARVGRAKTSLRVGLGRWPMHLGMKELLMMFSSGAKRWEESFETRWRNCHFDLKPHIYAV